MTPASSRLQGLESFTVKIGLNLERTTMEVTDTHSTVVARLSKPTDVRAPAAYELGSGPDGNEPYGRLTPFGALDESGSVLGVVNLSHPRQRVPHDAIHPLTGSPRMTRLTDNPAHWSIVQPGVEPLSGSAAGVATRLMYNRVTQFAYDQGADLWMVEPLVPLHFRYRSASSPGVTVRRTPGRAHFALTVHDDRLDRRLPLALVAAMCQYVLVSPGTEAVSAANLARRLARRGARRK